MDDKEELTEVEDTHSPSREGKIGFESGPIDGNDPNIPLKEKKTKFSNQRKTKLQKACFGLFIPAMILSVASTSYFFMPFISAVAGVFAFLIIGIIILAPIVCTAFLILVSDSFREFVGKAWKIVEWFFDAPNHISELAPYYPIVAFPALVLDLVTLFLCIVTLRKGQKGVVTYLIFMAIFIVAIIINLIIYYANGGFIPTYK